MLKYVSKRQWVLILLSGLFIFSACFFFIMLLSRTTSTFHLSSTSHTDRTPTPTPTPQPTPNPGFTVLLMGDGGIGHDGGALTDTMLLVRIVDATKTILMLSIPRDLWVNIPYDGGEGVNGKINSAYAIGIDAHNYKNKLSQYTGASGGGALAKDVVTAVTGLPIDRYLTIDFSGFEQAIDTIGGVDINVTTAFTDYEYPIAGREDLDCRTYTPNAPFPSASPSDGQSPLVAQEQSEISLADLIAQGKLDASTLTDLPAQFPCRYELLHFDAGLQHMDGATALKFVRSRHSAQQGNDFYRGSRQRQLIEAVATKLFSLGEVSKIPQFIATVRSHIDTDVRATDILSFLPRARDLHSYTIVQTALTTDNYLNQGYTSGGQFELVPTLGEGQYTAIHNWIGSLITPSISLQYPIIEVDSTNPKASASASLVSSLEGLGFPTKVLSSSSKQATTSATLLIQNSHIDSSVLEKIEQLGGITPSFMEKNIKSSLIPISDLKILLPE
ncbi:hypothetical protein C5B42_00515 [Candidatus Cerribacteria bacterium 'Amazon FNV 2010 28 9']|uniref:Cell envelope-related transcriptional attenuator domain-containing protein n=1 Tax=Candidatus Cerribacteria bacterium 'Amazon FNV 2010 28 9' TaxID=2081795 RepID=A0A317JV92_9BACT|nr:MAG: hypothetical protein C5B42_00515 [Candidatus Cerribacteria bacterium 'Amazon FNV 2010 28 9']